MRIALVSDATNQTLLRPLASALASAGIAEPALRAVPYALHALLDPDSEIYRHEPSVIVVQPHIEELAPELLRAATYLAGPDKVAERCAAVVATIRGLIAAARRHADASVLVAEVVTPAHPVLGIAGDTLPLGPRAAWRLVNEGLAVAVRETTGARLLASEAVARRVGAASDDPKRRFLTGELESPALQRALSEEIVRHVVALTGRTRKVLVLDLDNTLWGGVIGEDGIDGIVLGPTGPGRAYRAFQEACEDLRQQGVLLAIASKNDESNALEALAEHPHAVLRPDAFAARQIHWEDKATSCRRIAETLQVGLDSLVFFDDNPVEREWVRTACPGVHVVEVPADAARYVDTLRALSVFEQASLSAEDAARTDLYAAQAARREAREAHETLEAYLTSLQTTLTLGHADEQTLPRCVQLVNKTNQANMTTIRRQLPEVSALASSRDHEVIWGRIVDRFGDAGIIGVAIVKCEARAWDLDTFLLSCRALKRGVEGAFVQCLVRAAAEAGARLLTATWRRTAKNGANRYLFRDCGLEVVSEAEDEVRFQVVPSAHWRSPQAAAHTLAVAWADAVPA